MQEIVCKLFLGDKLVANEFRRAFTSESQIPLNVAKQSLHSLAFGIFVRSAFCCISLNGNLHTESLYGV